MAAPRLTDDFLRGVADDYARHAESRRPSEEVAAERGVPAATVRTWVMKARRRGFLAPRMSAQDRRDAQVTAAAYRAAADEIQAEADSLNIPGSPASPDAIRGMTHAADHLRARADQMGQQ